MASFWKRIFKRETSTAKPLVDMSLVTSIPQNLWSEDDVNALTASSVACVKRCMEIKCGALASLGLHYYKKKTDGGHSWFKDDEGDVLDVLLSEKPNHRQNAYDFMWDIIWQREMNGDAYVVPIYDSGILVELIPIPEGMAVSYNRNTGTYTVNDSYDQIFGEFAESEIIHIKSYSQDGFLGTPVTTLARTVLNIARRTYMQQESMFTPGSTLRGFITGETNTLTGLGEAQDDQLETVTNRIRRELREGNHLAYLPGVMKFVPVSMTPADLQLLDSMKFINLEICRFFGVPPTQVFQDSNVNYKSSESSQTIFMTSTLAPLMKQVENEFNIKLLTPLQRKRARIKFNLTDYHQSDPTVMAQSIGSLVTGGVMTANEARERFGLPPIEGGDELKMQDAASGDKNGGGAGNNEGDNEE